jgi:hypothetical protein
MCIEINSGQKSLHPVFKNFPMEEALPGHVLFNARPFLAGPSPLILLVWVDVTDHHEKCEGETIKKKDTNTSRLEELRRKAEAWVASRPVAPKQLSPEEAQAGLARLYLR